MSGSSISRRSLLKSAVALAVIAPLVEACGRSPATAPAASGSTSSAPTAVAPAATAAPSGGTTSLSLATRAGITGDWMRGMAQKWAAQNPNVKLTIDQVNYNDMAKKQLLQLAAGNMEDVTFSGVKWYPYSVFKGAFRAIDDYVKSHDPGMDDFLPSTIGNATFEGKLYGLPDKMDNGNAAIAIFNLDILGEKGIALPTDDWTLQDFVDIAQKANAPDKKVFGTGYFPGTYYDFASLARTWGTDVFSSDSSKLLLNTDPKCREAAQWVYDLRTKLKVAPTRQQTQDQAFPSGQLATTFDSISGIQATTKTVGDKFKWDIAIFPKGPTGLRGYHTFTENVSIYAKSQQPEKAYDLMTVITSKEAGVYAVTQASYSPNCRKSCWSDPDVIKADQAYKKVFERVFAWISATPGAFPIPSNLRFSELEDKWENVGYSLFYGEVAFADGMKQVQQQLQAIMDEPRG